MAVPSAKPLRRRNLPSGMLLPGIATVVVLLVIFSAIVLHLRRTAHEQIRQTVIGRDAAVLKPVAMRQLRFPAATEGGIATLLPAVLETVQQENILGMAVFDPDGQLLLAAPETLVPSDLALGDYLRAVSGAETSRFHERMALQGRFVQGPSNETPVLEIILPLHRAPQSDLLGIVMYLVDGRDLARELAAIDQRFQHQTFLTLAVGGLLICIVTAGALLLLHRSQRALAEHTTRLLRTQYELSLAAKASALGQITSHLVHSLQGHVAGLRTVVNSRQGERSEEDWRSAAAYAERLHAAVAESVAMLSDVSTDVHYEVTPSELANSIAAQNTESAEAKGVEFTAAASGDGVIDSHRASLLCMVAANLVRNAVEATPPKGRISVELRVQRGDLDMSVQDTGTGIPDHVRPHLFEPGTSSRPGGSGLGLTISRLLARQMGGQLDLRETGKKGTTFRLVVPMA